MIEYATGLGLRLRDAASSAPLARKVLREGKRIAVAEPARDARDRAQRTLSSFPEPFKRLTGPARYPCGITTTLHSAQAELLAKL